MFINDVYFCARDIVRPSPSVSQHAPSFSCLQPRWAGDVAQRFATCRSHAHLLLMSECITRSMLCDFLKDFCQCISVKGPLVPESTKLCRNVLLTSLNESVRPGCAVCCAGEAAAARGGLGVWDGLPCGCPGRLGPALAEHPGGRDHAVWPSRVSARGAFAVVSCF